jgi:hypothetical protein
MLRTIAGVDEDTLRWVWHERTRHTALGGVILGTATIAAVSMANLIGEIRPDTGWLAVVPASVWSVFVLNLDRWLVSSQVRGAGRVGTFLVRFGLAFLFGVLIAEPLVLRAFQPAIEQHVHDQREEDRDRLAARLVSCNPEAGPRSAQCTDQYILNFEATPTAQSVELAQLRAEATQLSSSISADSATLIRLQDQAQSECLGISGDGFTGEHGVGPECLRRRAAVDVFAKAHPLGQQQERLRSLQARIDQLVGAVGSSTSGFVARRSALITERVNTLPDPSDAPDLLQRMRALEELAGASLTLTIAAWALRIFFITVDCLPVLVKFLAAPRTTTNSLLPGQAAASGSTSVPVTVPIGSTKWPY